ncbi:hypothetical protein [Acidisphaera sp. L21]|uniref:hypothetical protein n=1 Tax=Acidisphaera sp. L21 TaxID=1641851 RepID=UPI00131D7FA1|nr:hypothetical protein [Acidisphaera sp. L21]
MAAIKFGMVAGIRLEKVAAFFRIHMIIEEYLSGTVISLLFSDPGISVFLVNNPKKPAHLWRKNPFSKPTRNDQRHSPNIMLGAGEAFL